MLFEPYVNPVARCADFRDRKPFLEGVDVVKRDRFGEGFIGEHDLYRGVWVPVYEDMRSNQVRASSPFGSTKSRIVLRGMALRAVC